MPDVDAPIELHISDVTADELVDAFLARDRALQSPLRRWSLALALLFVVLVGGYFVEGAFNSPGLDAFQIGVFVLLGAIVLVMLRPRRLYRMSSRRLVRDNPDLHAPATVTITDSGLRRRTATGQADVGWERYKLYVESDASFLLLVSDRPAAAVEILPKRALVEAGDVERMRALLDRHLASAKLR